MHTAKAYRVAFISILTGLLCSQGASANTVTSVDNMPQTPEQWVQYLSNFTQNAEMLADPKKFVAALSAVTEPRFFIAALDALMNPSLYMQSVASLMDPRAYNNYARTMDPKVLAEWTRALMDPHFYAAVATVFTDPNKLVRWVMTPLDPSVMSVVLNLLNPSVYLRWGALGLDPRLWVMLSNTMNPTWYGAWLSGSMTPQRYSPTAGYWIQPPLSAPIPFSSPGNPISPIMPLPLPQ